MEPDPIPTLCHTLLNVLLTICARVQNCNVVYLGISVKKQTNGCQTIVFFPLKCDKFMYC